MNDVDEKDIKKLFRKCDNNHNAIIYINMTGAINAWRKKQKWKVRTKENLNRNTNTYIAYL